MRKTIAILLCLLCTTVCFARKTHIKTNEPTLSDEQAQNFKYYFYEALRCVDSDHHDQTLILLQYCEAIDPTDATTYLLLGVVYEQLGYDSIAVNHYQQAVKYDEELWTARRKSIEILSTTAGNEKQAIASIQTELKQNPRNDEAWNMLAIWYKHLGKSQKAINALNQLEKIVGIDEYISREKYQHYSNMGKSKKAIAEIDRLMAEFPDDYRYQVFKGNIFLVQNKLDEAYELFQNALNKNPDNPYIYLSLAEYYEQTNEPKKSLQCVLKAIENQQLDLDTKLRIVALYVSDKSKRLNENSEFEQMFRALVEQYPFDETVHGYYALYLLENNRLDEVEQTLRTMTDINPKKEYTWSELINLQIQKQNYAEVAALAQKAMEHLPNSALMYFYNGIAKYMLNDFVAALQNFEQGVLWATDEQQELKSQMYAQIGDINHLLHKHTQAYEAYEAALKINQNNLNVLNNYAYFLANDNVELKKAERMSSQTIKAEPNNSIYLDTYAWILYRQNKCALAYFYIKFAIENLTPEIEGAEIWEHCGKIMQCQGKTKEAEEAFEKAKKIAERENENSIE